MTCLPFSDTKPLATVDLFCLTYAGGSTAVYRDWNRLFPDWISVRPVEYPGRGTRMGERLESDPARLADQLLAELRPHLARPYALFGHSLGAALGYRIALGLMERLPPLAFFPSGRHSPDCEDPAPKRAHLDDAGLLDEVRALNGSPREVLDNRELMALLLPIIRSDFRLSETIRAERDARPLACPLHVFGGTGDPEVPVEGIGRWRTVAAGDFSQTLIEGDHFFLHHASHVQTIADRIAAVLAPLAASPPAARRRA
ncbi:alpha/beta fold hydrolase [Shinella yambaruensis]|uniref:Thioesterase n=1 Tax=Shinella yambaruensis TaxID=415996 RepID=A0ABQ5ZPZ9_9HYPH|nr:alpha/beta fold hydrolase [Shinella yambaruensis]MCJ8029626.1 alpha/beta fold hydrolase [Shinella yambaruensis]MCU7983902.1 alpha/beta fold hydrolase [Shinella yambaruensis]GLR54171.1 thioesterase [Shinella yambaruensis]